MFKVSDKVFLPLTSIGVKREDQLATWWYLSAGQKIRKLNGYTQRDTAHAKAAGFWCLTENCCLLYEQGENKEIITANIARKRTSSLWQVISNL